MISRTRRGNHQITLARALSKHGIASRSQARVLIRGGRVCVNDKVVRDPDTWLDPRTERLAIDGLPIKRQEPIYLALHKPAGVVTTRSDERGRKTVYHLLPEGCCWLFPVGRLDKETSGLLLLTNDTRFGDQVTDPQEKISKTYEVHLEKPFLPDHVRVMESRMQLPDGTILQPAQVKRTKEDPARCEVTILEGKNRQIRRMFGALGYRVLALKRLSIGPIQLGNLREGETRPLTVKERSSILLHTTARG